MLDYTELQEYINDLKHYEGFKTLQKYKDKFYVYKGIIIDSNWKDVDDAESDEFEPFYNAGYTRQIGLGSDAKYDYMPNVLVVEFEKDIKKFKDDIIKYIDKLKEK